MMTNRHVAVAIALFVLTAAHHAHAQEPANQEQKAKATVTVEELTAPTLPAFVLLGITPESVDRPESTKAFVFSTFSAVLTGTLPTDMAMQVAPYWMKSNPTLTFKQYQEPNWRQSMKQTFAISIGTSPIPGASPVQPVGTHLAVGFTVRPWNGKPSASLAKKVDDLTTAADAVLDAAERGGGDEKASAEVTKAALAIQALDARRIGFFLTISGGQVWDFSAGDASTAVAKRRGIWVTPAWRLEACSTDNAKCESSVDLVFVGRLLKDPGADAMVDLGGRLAWNPNKEFSLSAEVVHRNPGETVDAASQDSADSSVRAAGILQYKLSDDFILFGTFGRDFEKATGAKPLLTLVGLNFGFGSKAAITR